MEPRERSNRRSAHAPSAATDDALRAERILAAVRFAAESFLTSQTMSERIDRVLALLGSAANVSRVYVFENERDPDGALITSQRFEWVDERVEPQLENPMMQRMNFEEMGLESWSTALARGQLYEAKLGDFSPGEVRFAKPQQILSFVLVPLQVESDWWGFIGFDDCISAREWTDPEKDALKAAGSILSAAIQGWRAKAEKQRLLDEQRSFTQAAWRRAAEWEAVLSSIVDGVWVLDTKSMVTFANEGAKRILDMPRADDLLQPYSEYLAFSEILDMADRAVAADELPPCRSLKGEAVDNMSLQFINRTTRARKFIRMSSAPIQDATGAIFGAVAVATDVTEGVEFARLKDQFIRVAAHELKTPVAIMKGYAQLALRTGSAETPIQQDRLQAIDRGADRIDRIVQDLLGVSQIYAEGFKLDTKRVDLRELTVAAIGAAAREHPDRPIDLNAEEPAPIVADPERISFVLQSMVDNAIRYSPGGGPIEVRIQLCPKDPPGGAPAFRPRKDLPTVRVCVADQGVGIPLPLQRHIFEPFFRAHTDTPYDHGGMGVGLFTSREIVRQHGGAMWFESTEGVGSKFYIQLPLGEDDDLHTQGADRR